MELYRDQRFVVRNFRIGDVEAHAANRNDASTAEFQSWSLPYPIEKAEESIARFIELAKPTDGESFGYVIADPTTDALIDRTHQRRGIGWKTLDLLAHYFRAQGCEQLLVSWVPGRGSPEPLYLRYGFIPTGEVDGEEPVASLTL